MNKKVNDKLLTLAIIVISVAGLLYFGFLAIQENQQHSRDNPYEYDIEEFKKSGRDQLQYSALDPIGLDLESPQALALDRFDNIYIAGDRQINRYDSTGNLSLTFEIPENATALAVNDSGDLYLALLDHVEILDSTGRVSNRWSGLGEAAYITSIAIGEDVYIADAGQLVVWRFDVDGQLLNKIGEKDEGKGIQGFLIPSPYFDVAIDPDGYIWAVNTGRHQFENYYPDGGLRATWSKSSMTVEGFSGCCNPTHIAILPDGSFVTTEKGIARVKLHNRIGEFVALVAGADQFKEGTVGLDVAVDSYQRIVVLDPDRKLVLRFQKEVS